MSVVRSIMEIVPLNCLLHKSFDFKMKLLNVKTSIL